MTKAKMRLYLEITIDHLQRVSNNLCHEPIKRDEKIEILEELQEIVRRIFLVDSKLKEVKFNDRQR